MPRPCPARRARAGLLLGALVIAPLVAGAGCRTRPPFDLAAANPTVAGQVLTRARAREILNQLPPTSRRHLDQLIFLVDLPAAAGNENDPLRFYRRVQRELEQTTIIPPARVELVLNDMLRVLAFSTETAEGRRIEGYMVVRKMLGPASGALPSPGDALEAIASFPPPTAAAFLVQEYFADHHYHRWNLQETLVEALLAGDYGPAPLAVYEDFLRNRFPSRRPSETFTRVVRACQRELGGDFDRWYRGVRGSSYRLDTIGR